MILLSGKETQEQLKKQLKNEVAVLDVSKKLVILQVGNNNESNIYINQKKKFGEEVGILVEHKRFEEKIKEADLIGVIEVCNKDKDVGGIIIQLPIPKHLDQSKIFSAVDVEKDVDGLGAAQIGLFYTGNKMATVPATARGVISLLDFYKISLKSKSVVVVGRSNLVGRPVAQMCLNRNATVTICHSYTKNLENITQTADVLIVACGIPNFIGPQHVCKKQVVVDVGIHRTPRGICGDVDFGKVSPVVSAITPVPGGVGPLTVVSLFQNFIDVQKI